MMLKQNQCKSSQPPEQFHGSIAVLTSGGDCQGMNSVLYGLTCRYLQKQQPSSKTTSSKSSKSSITSSNKKPKNELFLIINGYQGLVDGSASSIIKVDIKFLRKHLYLGGTAIGSSRCKEFYFREGRRKAAKNLLKRNIENLVVIGGDGTLTGVNLLRKEWPKFVQELIHLGEIDKQKSGSKLNIIGIIGSIDNDFFGSDMTVGADSALFRVLECIDALKTTAKSHSRLMVVEVMGRNCGYLAISAALGTEASYVFIPESPQKSTEDWKRKLLAKIKYERQNGQFYHIIIVAEGACTEDGESIKSIAIKDFLNKENNFEARVVILGHLQRGGFTSAFDHLMSLQMGMEAYNIFETKLNDIALVLCINQGSITTKPLVYCIEESQKISQFTKEKNWNKVVEQRGPNFKNTWENYCHLIQEPNPSTFLNNSDSNKKSPCWAIVACGQPIPGMNGIIYALVRYGFSLNMTIIGYNCGIQGLLKNDFVQFKWQDVSGIISSSGCILGTHPKRSESLKISNQNIEKIIENLQQNNVKFICFIGDQSAFDAIKSLHKFREHYKHLIDAKYCYIPVSLIETKNLRLPWSQLGHDSALNKTLRLVCDLTHSTIGTFNKLYLIRINLFIISNLFAQPELFSIACGASTIYPNQKTELMETELKLDSIQENANDIRDMILQTHENKFILIHEPLWEKIVPIYQASVENFSNQIKIYQIDLTEIQLPTLVTPFDRKLGVKLGMECGRYFSNENFETTPIIINKPFLYESKIIKSRSISPQNILIKNFNTNQSGSVKNISIPLFNKNINKEDRSG